MTMKYAMTMDGKIAAYTGASRWVTGEEARHHVHEQRKKNTGIMVGIGTVLADDPMLNCRIEGGRDPIRIICDTHLKTPVTSKIVKPQRIFLLSLPAVYQMKNCKGLIKRRAAKYF